MSYEPKLGEQVVKDQDGVELLIRRHGPRTRHAAIRDGEHRPWLPATYEDLLDFIVGKPAPAEDPREAVEPAPAPVRWRCEGCRRSVPGYRVRGGPPTEHWHWNEGDSMAMYTCGPCVPVTDAQPAGAAP